MYAYICLQRSTIFPLQEKYEEATNNAISRLLALQIMPPSCCLPIWFMLSQERKIEMIKRTRSSHFTVDNNPAGARREGEKEVRILVCMRAPFVFLALLAMPKLGLI